MSEGGQVRRPAARSTPDVARRLRAPVRHGAGSGHVVLATATLVVCLAALVALTLARTRIAQQVRSPLSYKLADSDRVAYYVVDPDSGPSFRIGPNDRSLKLITHLLLPSTVVYDPEAEFAYGVVLIVRSLAGEELWRHELNIRTRQSKSDGDRFGWRHENAFLLGDDRSLTDDRMTRVRLPESDEDRLVELRLLPQVPTRDVSGLARVYVRRPRPVDDRTLRELALAPEEARALVDHLTYRDWDQLSEDEHRVKLSQVWERLAAEGEPGRDYQTLSIYETGFRLARGASYDARRLEVDRWRSLAINVIGPAELDLRTLDSDRSADLLEIYRRGLDGVDVEYPRGARTLTIPDGVHTLFIESTRRVELVLSVVDADAERVWLIEAERARREDEDGNEVLEPDRRRLEVVRVGAQWRERPRWMIAKVDDAAARIFRFDVRVAAHVAASWWREHGPTPSLDVCFLDADGVELGCDTWTGEPSIGSRFEGLREAGEASDVGEPERWYVVSEPQTLRVVAPAETTSVELRDPEGGLDQRLIIRGYGYWPQMDTTLAEPFRLYESERVRWRYPPLETRTWFPIRPSNHDALDDALAVTELLAQVRLVPDGLGSGRGARRRGDPDFDDRQTTERSGEDGWDPGPWVTLEPRGVHRRRLVLERLDDEAARWLVSRWNSSLFTRLWPDRPLIVDLSATGPGAPELHWQVDARTLGRELTLLVDGQAYAHTLAATRGRWRLPVSAGQHHVELEFDERRDASQFWLDRPALFGNPPVSRRRSIHQLTTTLRFPLVKPDVEALTVNVVVYVPRRRAHAELALSFDGGAPVLRTGVVGDRVSVPARTFTIAPLEAFEQGNEDARRLAREPTRILDLDARPGVALDVVTLALTLGKDVVPGPHELRVELLDGGRVWVRAFHRGVADRSKPAASWSEPIAGDR